MRHFLQAVEVETSLIDEGEKLKAELEEEKREKERQEKEEAEEAEREAATEELKAAIESAKESRDASGLSKPIKRAKKVTCLRCNAPPAIHDHPSLWAASRASLRHASTDSFLSRPASLTPLLYPMSVEICSSGEVGWGAVRQGTLQ